MNGTAMTADTISTVSPQAMMELPGKAQARVVDILAFATTVAELDWYLRQYSNQRQEAIDEGDVSAAIFCEYVLTGLERALHSERKEQP